MTHVAKRAARAPTRISLYFVGTALWMPLLGCTPAALLAGADEWLRAESVVGGGTEGVLTSRLIGDATRVLMAGELRALAYEFVAFPDGGRQPISLPVEFQLTGAVTERWAAWVEGGALNLGPVAPGAALSTTPVVRVLDLVSGAEERLLENAFPPELPLNVVRGVTSRYVLAQALDPVTQQPRALRIDRVTNAWTEITHPAATHYSGAVLGERLVGAAEDDGVLSLYDLDLGSLEARTLVADLATATGMSPGESGLWIEGIDDPGGFIVFSLANDAGVTVWSFDSSANVLAPLLEAPLDRGAGESLTFLGAARRGFVMERITMNAAFAGEQEVTLHPLAGQPETIYRHAFGLSNLAAAATRPGVYGEYVIWNDPRTLGMQFYRVTTGERGEFP